MSRGHFRRLPVSGDAGLIGTLDITDVRYQETRTGHLNCKSSVELRGLDHDPLDADEIPAVG